MNNYLYQVNYKCEEEDLCHLEQEALLGEVYQDKIFLSKKEIQPSISPFIKMRLKLIYVAPSFVQILNFLDQEEIKCQEFMVKYVAGSQDKSMIKKGKEMSREIGLRILGQPSFKEPKVVFGITNYGGKWYFGEVEDNNNIWKDHQTKPYSYSSSIGINLAKALINIASRGDRSMNIIDPCCGVGTLLLEGAFAGYRISGRELNWKVAENARKNITHFHYDVDVTTGDIRDIRMHYDVAIVDLPYNNFTLSDDEDQWMLIKNAKRISDRLVLVSSRDIKNQLELEGFRVDAFCKVNKKLNRDFARYVWVCY